MRLTQNGELTSRILGGDTRVYRRDCDFGHHYKPLISGDLYFWGAALLRRPSMQDQASFAY